VNLCCPVYSQCKYGSVALQQNISNRDKKRAGNEHGQCERYAGSVMRRVAQRCVAVAALTVSVTHRKVLTLVVEWYALAVGARA